MGVYFKHVPVGQRFECNGNVCIKVSTRTARLVQYGRVFYFRHTDLCHALTTN